MYKDELAHHGVLGMKWGVRKSRSKSSGSSKKSSGSSKKSSGSSKKSSGSSKKLTSKKKKILTDSQKQTLKKVGKTAAIVAGSVLSATTLGYLGSVAYNTAIREWNNTPTSDNISRLSSIIKTKTKNQNVNSKKISSIPGQLKEDRYLVQPDFDKWFSSLSYSKIKDLDKEGVWDLYQEKSNQLRENFINKTSGEETVYKIIKKRR